MMMEMEVKQIRPFAKSTMVCSCHFEDFYLKKYIEIHGHTGTCSYCKQKGKVLAMTEFMQFVTDKLQPRLCPIDEASLPVAISYYDDENEEIPGLTRVGIYVMPKYTEYYEDPNKLIQEYGLYTSDQTLNEDIRSCFSTDEWVKKDVFEGELDEELSYEWNYFVEMVKHKKRYTFFQDSLFIKKEAWKDDVLTEIQQMCKAVLKSELRKGTKIFRGRPNDSRKARTTFEELTAPPPAHAKENRMSATGISMFYGAFDEKTSIAEIKNYAPKSSIDLGEFELKRDIEILDLFKIPNHISFWMPKYYEEYKFLKKFHDEITRPIIDNPGIEYIPTQIFTEYIRFLNIDHIDGIVYKSSLTGKENIVLFYDNITTKDILQLNRTHSYPATSSIFSYIRALFLQAVR